MEFHLAARGTTSRTAGLHLLLRPGELDTRPGYELRRLGLQPQSDRYFYDSLRGLHRANFLGLEEPTERMEDGSLAPWTKIRIEVQYGPDADFDAEGRVVAPQYERFVVTADMLIPSSAVYGEYGNKIAAFRWVRPGDTIRGVRV